MSISAGTRRVNETGLAPQYPPVGTNHEPAGHETEELKLVAGNKRRDNHDYGDGKLRDDERLTIGR